MINKEELHLEIDKISYEILDEIVCPVTGLKPRTIWADIFLADISCYLNHVDSPDEKEREIIKRICEKYGFKSLSEEEFISPIDDRWPLALIALYILLNGEADHLTFKKDDIELGD